MIAAESLAPDADVMARFLEHAFGGYLDGLHDGLVEISHCANQGDKPNEVWRSRLFGTDELDEAVAFAAEQNAKGHNLYFAPALRNPASPRDKRGNKAGVVGTLLLWCEWDDEESFNAAREKFRFAKPTAGEITGTIPSKRAQAFWRLDTAMTGVDAIDGALNGLCVSLGGDPKVVHADCLMRLPGSVSWRKLDKPDRQNEMTKLTIGQDDRPTSYPVGQILQAYPPAPRAGGGASYPAPDSITRHSALGLGGTVTDGREQYMRDTVMACLREFIGTQGAAPTEQELYDMVWPQYSAHVDFSRPGRGSDEVRLKCASTLRRFNSGRIQSAPDLETVVADYAKKNTTPEVIQGGPAVNLETGEKIDNIRFRLVSFKDIKPNLQARYLVKGLIPAESLIIAWGPPKCGKSFWFSDVTLHLAAGMSYRGLKVRGGPVVYVAAEGAAGFMARVDAWKRLHPELVNIPFHVLPMRLDLVQDCPRFVADIRAQTGGATPVLVVIDTLNRTFTGSESSDEDMTAYVRAADAIKDAFYCSTAVIHHCGVDGTRPRGHTSLTGAADTQIQIQRDGSGLITAKVEWMKDGPEDYENRSRLEVVEIGHDEDGDAVTTCVVLASEDAPITPEARLSAPLYLALIALKTATAEMGETSGQSHIPSSARCVPVAVWRKYYNLRSVNEEPDKTTQSARQKAFKRASEELLARGVVGSWNDLVWVAKDAGR